MTAGMNLLKGVEVTRGDFLSMVYHDQSKSPLVKQAVLAVIENRPGAWLLDFSDGTFALRIGAAGRNAITIATNNTELAAEVEEPFDFEARPNMAPAGCKCSPCPQTIPGDDQ
jgi:hypothetical protein